MIDIDVLKRAARDAAGEGRPIELTPACFHQLIAELEAGRRAQAEAGQTFGLPRGVRL
ncbi:hypothetical protein [Novosphingobium album (ex Liu et al. 2023)]|uniref:Uncharacterized protein n=1 Tax=Novosphingobium album (ex Liu et al. 2023) TaxID=3031130 RepID=A0ABT5WYG6_9SPHN|nr:hypothetical protein [Novosphingobium album (ex Liu et al. 2023)]MDE8654788.1 hypothetical protein [Novosphingobium album (ex Liu et al. 2023)]